MWSGLLMRGLNMRILLLSILYFNFKDNNALQRLGLQKVATSHWRHIILSYRRACIDIFFKLSAVVVETWLSLFIIQSHLVRTTVSHAFYTFVSDVCENRHKHIRRHHTHPLAHHTSERARTYARTHARTQTSSSTQMLNNHVAISDSSQSQLLNAA